jgi:hypothetical protein
MGIGLGILSSDCISFFYGWGFWHTPRDDGPKSGLGSGDSRPNRGPETVMDAKGSTYQRRPSDAPYMGNFHMLQQRCHNN